MRGATSNIVAGIFLLAGLAAFVVVALVLAGFRESFVAKTPYVIRLSLADGAEGLIVGSPVKVGGIPVGRVTGLKLEPSGGADKSEMDILATVSVNADIHLLRNAVAYLQRPLLGGSAWFNLPSLGARGDATGPGGVAAGDAGYLAAGEELKGVIAPPEILAQAGYGPEQRKQVQEIIKSAKAIAESGERLTTRLDRVAAELEGDVKRFVKTANESADDVKDVTGQFRARSPEWTKQVDSVLTRVDKSSATLAGSLEKADKFVDSVREGWAGWRGQVDTFIGTANTLAGKLNTDGYKRLTDALDAAKAGVEVGQRLLERGDRMLAEGEPAVRESLANLRMASDQLAMTLGEVRRAPWKLLYQPGRKELEQELVYDAARRYAEAASDLNRATQALAAIGGSLGKPEASRSAEEQAQVKRVLARLDETVKAYDEVEREFLRRLKAEGKAQPVR